MKIYFAGSIRGGRDDVKIYFDIIDSLKKYGTVLTEHIGDNDLLVHGEPHLTEAEIYHRDMSWLKESEVIVAEVTSPSLGVGYEIGQAESLGKKILCLYQNSTDKKLSAMIDGNQNLTVAKYSNLEEAKNLLENFFRK
ncbi:MAG: nucleoside 2-deoxyribosyltransferase [Candidatus Uhrbacteria bacterium]